MIQLVVLCVFALFDFSASSSHTDVGMLGIVGGAKIDIEIAPYMAAIRSYNTYKGCGAIISTYNIVTVAHILPNVRLNSVLVRVGSSNWNKGGEEFPVSQLTRHPKYRPEFYDYDFMVITLAQPLVYTRIIRPVKLPPHNAYIRDRDMLYVTGWGDTTNTDHYRTQLSEVRIPVFNTTLCQDQYGRYLEITARMICTCGNTENRGDGLVADGAVAIYKEKLIGLASTVKPNTYGIPTIFTRVASVSDWLEVYVDKY